MKKITPFLWFDGNAEEAAQYYVSIFKNGRITDVTRYEGTDAVMTVLKRPAAVQAMLEMKKLDIAALRSAGAQPEDAA